MGKANKPKNGGTFASVMTSIVYILAAVFMILLAVLKMIPGKYLAILGCVLLVIIVILSLMMHSKKRKGMRRAGVAFSILLCVIMVLGMLFSGRALSALGTITKGDTETVDVGVYVRMDDPAQKIEDLSGYSFGMIGILDRENSEKALSDVGKQLGEQIAASEYLSMTGLIDALEGEEVDAVVCNSAFLDILEETDGYEDIRDRIREISIVSIKVDRNTPSEEKERKSTDPFTVYISGVDSRTGLYSTSRSDVNIIATFNPATRQVLLVSTPRDYFVPLSISNGQRDKLTHAGIYGVDVSMDTLEMLYGIDIDYYFKVSFGGVTEIVDSLGGIVVNSQYEFTTKNSRYHFVQGENYLDGEQALAFARERYAFADGDNQRGRNQMAVIRGIIDKATSVEVLTNYLSIMSAAEGTFDTSIPYDMIAQLVRDQLDSGKGWDVVTYSATGTGSSEITFSQGVYAYVMIPDEESVETGKQLMNQVMAGEVVTAP